MKKLVIFALTVFLLFGVYSATITDDASATFSGPATGLSVSGFTTEDLDGNPVDSSIFGNAEITVLNLWANWCAPCIGEMPDFQKLTTDFGSGNTIQMVSFIWESNGCTPDSAKRLLDANEYSWLNLRINDNDMLMKAFTQDNAIPQTFIVNSEGTILAHQVGSFEDYNSLLDFIAPFLSDATILDQYREPDATEEPTAEPTAAPTEEATAEPTAEPTEEVVETAEATESSAPATEETTSAPRGSSCRGF